MLRNAVAADLPAMLELYRPYVTGTAVTFEYEVPTLAAFTDRFLQITREFPWLVWEENGEILGYAYGSRAFERAAYQWDADLSVYLRQDCRGRGLGRTLYTALEARLDALGYHVLYALVTSDNEASCRFHEALGYRAVARLEKTGFKFGRWHDLTWFEKRLQDGDPAHPPRKP